MQRFSHDEAEARAFLTNERMDGVAQLAREVNQLRMVFVDDTLCLAFELPFDTFDIMADKPLGPQVDRLAERLRQIIGIVDRLGLNGRFDARADDRAVEQGLGPAS